MPNPLGPNVSQELIDALGLRETTGPVLARMEPHPDELKLVPLDGPPDWEDREPSLPWWLELEDERLDEEPPF